MNELLLFGSTLLISVFALVALRLGKSSLIAFIAAQSILANLFVVKQIGLFGYNATASDVFMIGSIFGLHLLQEYHGKKQAQEAVAASFFLLIFYTIVSQIHLLYTPATHDVMQQHFYPILYFMPRIAIASIIVYTSVMYLDTLLYAFFRKLFGNKNLLIRNTLCIMISQLADTVLFSFLGLYGIINNIGQVIVVSYTIKMVVMLITRPFLAISKKIVPQE